MRSPDVRLVLLVMAVLSIADASDGDDKRQTTGADKQQSESVIGTWDAEARHLVMRSLYQPEMRTRLRSTRVHFKHTGDALGGFSLVPEHTPFRGVTFAKGQLVFEFDIDQLNHGWGHQTKSKAWIRVEAELKGDRLVGKWRLFQTDGGDELFRGEWEAVRSKTQEPGTIVLAGGGDLPEAARDAFFALAGGKDTARIVVIPTAMAEDTYTGKEETDILEPWSLGPKSVRLLHTRDRKTANDAAFIEPLTKATGVWFTNGHTDRLLNAYQGTKVEAELKKLLERGGVVGGQDAGAVVLAERVYQRFEPDVLSQGYGLLPGVMMARGLGDPKRVGRSLLDRNPQYLGLGLPSGTAVIVRGPLLQVVGAGSLIVYRAKSSAGPAREDRVPPGGRYSLTERAVVK